MIETLRPLPTREFIAALPAEWNRYATTRELVDPPAILLRPDQPWISRDAYDRDVERYVAIGIVTASDPDAGSEVLYTMVRVIAATCDTVPGWAFDVAGRIVTDTSTGVTFLAAAVRLVYRASEAAEG